MYVSTILSASLLLFTACSSQNGFSKFHVQERQERALENIKSSKIIADENIQGIMSAIYLNDIYPLTYNQNEYFLLSFYLKDEATIYDEINYQDSKLRITLNEKLPLKIKELEKENRFSDLIGSQNEWRRYYLIAFPKEEVNALTLLLRYGSYASSSLVYLKNRE